VMTAGDLILGPIREAAQKATVLPAFECCRVVPAQLGQDSGIVGAALMARDLKTKAA
jgi:predicted NBD/HSP70 family sugar kinase